MIRISIAFPKHRTAETGLASLGTTRMKRSLFESTKQLHNLAWMAGGIDLSLNDDTQKGQGVAWQPQFYGFAEVTDVAPLSKALRETYSPSKTAPRPVQMKKCDRSAQAYSYAFKASFIRRIAYKDQQDRWNTRKVSLRPAEHVQAMLWMDQVGLSGRLFLKNVRMTRVGDSVGLVRIKKLE